MKLCHTYKNSIMMQVFLFAALWLFSMNAWAATVGAVVDAKGDVTITRAAESVKAVVGSAVHVGDIIRTADESMTRITLDGGDEISLGYNSKFIIDDYKLNSNKEIILAKFKALAGKFKFAVEKMRYQETYLIQTKTAVLGVRGTRWLTLVEDKKTRVSGLDGLVSVTVGDETKLVAKGETVVATLLGVGAVIATPAIILELFLQEGISASLSGAAASSGTVAAASTASTTAGAAAGVSTTAILGGVAAAAGVAAVAGGGGGSNSPSSEPIPTTPASSQDSTPSTPSSSQGVTGTWAGSNTGTFEGFQLGACVFTVATGNGLPFCVVSYPQEACSNIATADGLTSTNIASNTCSGTFGAVLDFANGSPTCLAGNCGDLTIPAF
ncbi:MAG: FecR family protein [Mariprofundaceae bacterium]